MYEQNLTNLGIEVDENAPHRKRRTDVRSTEKDRTIQIAMLVTPLRGTSSILRGCQNLPVQMDTFAREPEDTSTMRESDTNADFRGQAHRYGI
jgi:hypothetical protein